MSGGIGGYANWTTRVLRSGPILAGRQMNGNRFTVVESEQGIGIAVPHLGGGDVYQYPANPAGAPMVLAPVDLSLTINGVGLEDDYDHLLGLRQRAGYDPIQAFVELPMIDVWMIRGDGTTVWTLSRSFAFATASYANYVPVCSIENHPNDGADASPVSLTVVNSGSPSATEIKIISTTDGTSVETANLDAHVGRSLVVKYHPLRLYRIGSLDHDIAEHNNMVIDLELLEVIPSRSY